TIHLTNALGCDSAATLVLSLKSASSSSTTISVCPTALPYLWNGNSYPAAGTYAMHLTNAVGCDSTATLILTLKSSTTSSNSISVCPSALPYSWNGNSYNAAGTYTVHLTNTAGCDSTATLILSLNASSVSTTPVTVCANALPYSWNGNSYNTAGTYTVHLTNSVGCDSAATLVLNTTALPVVNPITGGNSLCANNTLQLSSVTLAGTWSSSNTAAATVSNSGLVQGITAGNTTISYSLTNSCGTTTRTMNIVVGALPVVNPIVGNNNICVNTNTQLLETATGGTWVSNNTAVLIVDNTGLATALSGGTALVTYIATNMCGTDSQHISIVVSSSPFVSPITGNDSVCVNGTLLLTDITPSGIWTSATPSATVNANGLVAGVKSGTAIIFYTVTNTCGTTSKQFTVYINDVPAVADISGTNNICINTTTALTDITPSGTWTSSSISIAPISSVGVVTGASVGTATISYAVKNTCGTTTKTYGITVLATPAAFPIKGKDSLCTATTTQLSNAGVGGTWLSFNPAVATVDNNGKLLAVSAGIDTITYSITNFCGTAIDSFPVLVHPVPSCSFTINPFIANICLGDSIIISDNTTSNPVVTSLWNLGNGVVDSGMFITYTYPFANSYYITHRIIDQYGCISSPSKLPVIVQTLPTVNNGYTVYVLQNDSVTLNPQVTGLDNNSTINWSPGIFLNNNSILNPVCTPSSDITYTLTIKDSIGCPGKDTLHVVVLEPIQIPNVFSPNGDQDHDYWVIPNLDRFPGISLNVFDRNGQVVYTCRDKYVKWDGKYNGKDVPMGVYYYILDRGFKLPVLSGTITILR
ncbi:MAG: gliding motility-associated C-terminal domain-containing protein, partial [Bacteroidota bacterium]